MANIYNDRNQIPKEYTWAIEDLFASDELWEKELVQVAEFKEYFMQFAGKLCATAANLLAFLKKTEELEVRGMALANYCMRKSDVDTRDTKYQAMTGKFMSEYVGLNAATSFATPEIMAMSDETLEKFYKEEPELARYQRYLSDLRRRKEHILSAAEEKILASAGEIAQAPDNVYGMLMDADMTFQDAVDKDGNKRPLKQGTFISYQESADRELRKSAYENLYNGFAAFKNTAAGLLDAQNKQLKFFATTKKYDSAFEASLDNNNVPTSVYLNLIEAVHNNLDKLHRYIRIRKKALNVDDLHFYDIYTPLVADVDKAIDFEDAKNTVYEALAPLGEGYRNILKEGFSNRWIDVCQNEGKRSGAYSAGARVHPYVLLNYSGTLDSQFTLAHEMGHAIHSYLSNKTQAPLDADYVIFVAEVASTVNEALMIEHLLRKTTDKKERAYLINHYLDQFRGTLFRQTMFAEFELNIGKMVKEGQTLTADVLCNEYRRLNKLYYGDDIVVDDHIAMEWARIPHFYYNYYVYQYATGYSAAIAISRRILTEGESAVKDYIQFLSGGCSRSPIDLLKIAGVDMNAPDTVNSAMQLFGELLDDLEKLLEV